MKMREVVHVQLGKCGNDIGREFWKVIADEHGVGADGVYSGESDMQLNNIAAYFNERPAHRYVPRAILIDLDPSSFPAAKCSAFFNTENFVVGRGSAGNNWATGYYTEGAELVENALDIIRRETDACDTMQGIQMVRALGGGTGSGVGSLLMTKLRDEYPDRIVKCYSVMPSSKMPKVVVETYNAVLGLCTSINCANLSVCVDNDALHRICMELLRISTPTNEDTNHLMSTCMAGVTCSLRFPGQPAIDLRKMYVNLVPFPRLHFFVAGYAPITCKNAAVYEGASRVEEQMSNLQSKNSLRFVDWIANNVQSAICKVAPRGVSMGATVISNTTALQQPLKRLTSRFAKMLKNKDCIHWYAKEGMDVSEFEEARKEMSDLIDEYDQHTKQLNS